MNRKASYCARTYQNNEDHYKPHLVDSTSNHPNYNTPNQLGRNRLRNIRYWAKYRKVLLGDLDKVLDVQVYSSHRH